MRALTHLPIRPHDIGSQPVPAKAQPGEPTVATWCRDIATAVAAALHTVATGLYTQHVHSAGSTPAVTFVGFTITGHPVQITVVDDDPPAPPAFALTVDGQRVEFDTHSPARNSVVLAHAIWQAITTPTPARRT